MKTCSFFGHRHLTDDISDTLTKIVDLSIKAYGVKVFYVGGYGEFDYKATLVVNKLKEKYPDIKLYLCLAYLPQPNKKIDFLELYDGTIFLDGLETGPRKFAITKRNRLMVDKSDVVICYIKRFYGGAYAAAHYADCCGRVVWNCI